jgi:hypothetical protein
MTDCLRKRVFPFITKGVRRITGTTNFRYSQGLNGSEPRYSINQPRCSTFEKFDTLEKKELIINRAIIESMRSRGLSRIIGNVLSRLC